MDQLRKHCGARLLASPVGSCESRAPWHLGVANTHECAWHRGTRDPFVSRLAPISLGVILQCARSQESLLGVLHEGWAVAMESLPYERLGNARYARSTRIVGLLERCISNGDSGADTEVLLAQCLALGRMAELMSYSAISVNARGEDFSWQASAAFAINATYERAVAELAEKVLGTFMYVAGPDRLAVANGEIESLAVRQAPTVTIQAGTYQIQLSIIAKVALGFPRAR